MLGLLTTSFLMKRIYSRLPSHILRLLAQILCSLKHVPLILLLIEFAITDPEARTTQEGQDGHNTVVPDQKRVSGKRNQGLAYGAGKGGHEVEDRKDERTHVGGCLGESVFQTGDGGEDLGHTDKDVGDRLDPHIDWGRDDVAICISAAGRLVTAWRQAVDVDLSDAGADHGCAAEEEAHGHALDWGEADAGLTEARVDDHIEDGNHDDQGDWVEILDDVVGNAIQNHDAVIATIVSQVLLYSLRNITYAACEVKLLVI